MWCDRGVSGASAAKVAVVASGDQCRSDDQCLARISVRSFRIGWSAPVPVHPSEAGASGAVEGIVSALLSVCSEKTISLVEEGRLACAAAAVFGSQCNDERT